jgi:hypothetical protein
VPVNISAAIKAAAAIHHIQYTLMPSPPRRGEDKGNRGKPDSLQPPSDQGLCDGEATPS